MTGERTAEKRVVGAVGGVVGRRRERAMSKAGYRIKRIRELRALERQALASMSEPRSGELRSCLPRKCERERAVSFYGYPALLGRTFCSDSFIIASHLCVDQ